MARPTHIGNTTYGFGLVTVAVGDDPDAPVGDAPTPDDVAPSVGVLFPVLIGSGNPAFVQSKYGTAITGGITLDATPTPGNILVFFSALREGTGVTVTPSGTGWTLIESANTGSSGNWPCFVYWRPVSLGDGTSWTATRSDAAVIDISFFITEFSGVASVDVSDESSDLTTEPTLSLTPVTTEPIILYSGVSLRRDAVTDFTPATGMTELHNEAAGGISTQGPQMAVNYRIVDAPTGSYTVGSTWGGGLNRAVIGVAFVGSAGGTIYINGPLITDGSDSTFEYVSAGAQGDASLEVVLGTAMRFASFRLVIGHDSAGSVEYAFMGANAANFSDEVELVSVTFTATGSFTADTVTASWSQSTGYRYYRLVPTTPDDIRIYTFSLYEPPDPGEAIDDHLTDATDAHDASAISFTPAGTIAATNVQAAIEEVASEAGGGTPATTVESETTFGISPAVGTDTEYARQDHTHGTPAVPDLDDLGDVNAPTPSDNDVLSFDSGTSTWVPVAPGSPTIDWGEDADISTLDYDDVADAGVLDEAARADHVHGMPSAGGGGSTDPTIPSGGTLFEFDSALSGWTDIGSITKDITTRPGALYLETPSNSGIQGIRRTGPSHPFTVTARMDVALIDTSNNTCGIHVCEASPGRIVYLGATNYGTSDTRITRRLYTNPTTYSSEAPGGNHGTLMEVVRGRSIWLRITVTSSSSIACYWSWDGTVWYTLETGLSSGGTITDWGFYVDRNSASGGAVKAAFPWAHIA